jgi:hypothetical protein
MKGYLMGKSVCYIISPERIIQPEDLDLLKKHMKGRAMSNAEITELLRRKRIGTSTIATIVKNVGTWNIHLPDIQFAGEIRRAYSQIAGHRKFQTRNFFKMLAEQGYTTSKVLYHEHGDENITTGTMGWSNPIEYTGHITARVFLKRIDAAIDSLPRI